MSCGFAAIAAAQDSKPPDTQADAPKPAPTPTPLPDPRASALQQLALSPAQRQEIRRINIARKPVMDEAQNRLREANRALDETIYADQVNDTDVQARLKDLHAAQAEVARIRYMSEVAVRKVLTPEQLVRFRELRRDFELARERIQNQNKVNNVPPRQLVRQGQAPLRTNANPNKEKPAAKPSKVPLKH